MHTYKLVPLFGDTAWESLVADDQTIIVAMPPPHDAFASLVAQANLAGDAIEALKLAATVAQSAAVTDSLNAILVRAKALEASHGNPS